MSPASASGCARPMKHVPAGMPEAPVVPGRLLAISDLHVSHPRNRRWVADLPPGAPGDWLLVAGDLAEKVEDIEWTLRTLRSRYGTVVWVPGNHDLWAHPRDPVKLRGEPRYQHLVALCRGLGVITPEDPYPVWTGSGGPAVVYGHLHIPRTTFQDGVRFEEVSLGYPYEQDRYPERPRQLIQILPPGPARTLGPPPAAPRTAPPASPPV